MCSFLQQSEAFGFRSGFRPPSKQKQVTEDTVSFYKKKNTQNIWGWTFRVINNFVPVETIVESVSDIRK